MKFNIDLGKYDGNAQKRLNYIMTSGIDSFFTDKFIQNHTKNKTFTEFCSSIGCDFINDDVALENGCFDSAIKEHSDFTSWEDMKNVAFQTLFYEK